LSEETRNISIVVQASQAIRALNQIGTALQNAGSATGKTDAELRKVDQTLVRAESTSRKTAQTLVQLRTALKQMGVDATASSSSIRNLETRLETATARIRTQREVIRELREANKALAKDNTQLASTTEALVSGSTRAAGAQGKQAKSTRDLADSSKRAADATEDLTESFQQNALRYALYDVSQSFSRFRDAGVAALSDVLKTGIDFQKNFANVIRTSVITDPGLFQNSPLVSGGFVTASRQSEVAVQSLQKAFIDLQSTLPVTSEDLTRIGTLAAQMGVAASEVASFTEITAKFSAASGISADESATALSRIGQILATDVQGNYERLSSAILKTGVNAIATEQQIVRGTTQIAAIGKVAGFSTVEIVALSSAMSSLGMSPELQRSVVTSSFSRILTAVRGSREEAEKFGAVLNMTGQEFQDAFDNNGYETYRKLLATIANSPKSIQILQSLRLASQRLTPNLLRLGQSFGLLGETLADTQKGWNEEAELQRQFQVIMDTTAAKLQMLSQAWDGLVTILGGGFVDMVGNLADLFKDLVIAFQGFARTPIGGVLSTIVLTLATLATVVFAVMTAVSLAGAAFLGFNYVMTQLSASIGVSTFSLAGFNITLGQTTIASRAAGVGLGILKGALATLVSPLTLITAAIGAISFAVFENANFVRTDREAKGLSNSIQAIKKELSEPLPGDLFNMPKGFDDPMFNMPDWMISANRGLGGLALSNFNDAATWGKIRVLDEDLASLAKNDPDAAISHLKDLKQEWDDAGNAAEKFGLVFPDTVSALALLAGETDATTEQLIAYNDAQTEAETAETRRALSLEATANALGLATSEYHSAEDALNGYVNAVMSGTGAFFKFGDMLATAYGDKEGEGGGLARLQKDLDDSLVAVQTWTTGLSELTAKGAGNLAQAFAAEGPASQQAVLDALTLGPEALAQLEQSMADAAFFASEEYARTFASNNAVLADVYKKAMAIDPNTAIDAMHEARQRLLDSGGILDAATISALNSKYDIKLDLNLFPEVDPASVDVISRLQSELKITPVQVPVEVAPFGATGGTITSTIQGWQAEFNGQKIIIPVDPDTEEGQKIIQDWAVQVAAVPLSMNVDPKTQAAAESLRLFRENQATNPIWMDVKVRSYPTLDGTRVSTGGSFGGGRANGGPIGDIPRFAAGSRAPLVGPGTTKSDSIITALSRGEWVHNARAVQYYGPRMMDDINRMKFPKFANGGSPWFGTQGGNSSGNPSTGVNVTVTQYYPTTRDPIKTMKQDAEAVLAGIWT